MGNSSSFMEKIYIYLPVIMFNSRMDYSDPTTLRTMRIVYFVEQVKLYSRSHTWSKGCYSLQLVSALNVYKGDLHAASSGLCIGKV